MTCHIDLYVVVSIRRVRRRRRLPRRPSIKPPWERESCGAVCLPPSLHLSFFPSPKERMPPSLFQSLDTRACPAASQFVRPESDVIRHGTILIHIVLGDGAEGAIYTSLVKVGSLCHTQLLPPHLKFEVVCLCRGFTSWTWHVRRA